VVTELAGIFVNDLSDQRIDDSQRRGRTALAGGIRQTGAKIEPLAFLKAVDPIVDRLATDAQQFGDLISVSPSASQSTAKARQHSLADDAWSTKSSNWSHCRSLSMIEAIGTTLALH
jgi:hypothetical protein